MFSYFQEQNEKIANRSIADIKAKHLNLATLGIQNGCIDSAIQASAWPQYAYNNSYDTPVISKDVYEATLDTLTTPGGCLDQVKACRGNATIGDPLQMGNNATVNQICQATYEFCFASIEAPYSIYSNVCPYKSLAFRTYALHRTMLTDRVRN